MDKNKKATINLTNKKDNKCFQCTVTVTLNLHLNVLYVKKEIYPAYVSKHNSNHEKQVILLMIPIGEGWHYLAGKKLLALLRGVTSKNNSDFYCLNCPHSFRTKNKPESHKKYVKVKIFVML